MIGRLSSNELMELHDRFHALLEPYGPIAQMQLLETLVARHCLQIDWETKAPEQRRRAPRGDVFSFVLDSFVKHVRQISDQTNIREGSVSSKLHWKV